MRQVLAAFRSGGATILEGDVMLVYVNYVFSILFTWANIWWFTANVLAIYLLLKKCKIKSDFNITTAKTSWLSG